MSARLGECIWDRRGDGPLRERTYFALVAGFTVAGLFTSTTIAIATMRWEPSVLVILALWGITPLIGITIAVKNDQWWASLLGYAIVCVGIGAGTGPIVALSNNGTAIVVLAATLGVTKVTSVIAMAVPRLVGHWFLYGVGVAAAIGCTLTGYALLPHLELRSNTWDAPWMGMAFVTLFSCHIVHDWRRSRFLPRTFDNTIDCALAIYLDAVNVTLTGIRTVRMCWANPQVPTRRVP